jgi:hypothetical protein
MWVCLTLTDSLGPLWSGSLRIKDLAHEGRQVFEE